MGFPDFRPALPKIDATGAVLVNNEGIITSPDNFWDVNPVAGFPATETFLFEGDSIVQGQQASNPATTSYAGLFKSSAYCNGCTVRNTAVSGSTIQTMAARYVASVQPHRPTANGGDGLLKATLFIQIGINNIFGGTDSLATMSTALQDYITQAQSDGFTVILSTILGSSANTHQALSDQWNDRIRTSYFTNDGFWDGNASLPDPTNTTLFYTDGSHPIDAGYVVMAKALILGMKLGGPVYSQAPFDHNLNTIGSITSPKFLATGIITATGTGGLTGPLNTLNVAVASTPVSGTTNIVCLNGNIFIEGASSTSIVYLNYLIGGNVRMGTVVGAALTSTLGFIGGSSTSGLFLGESSTLPNAALSYVIDVAGNLILEPVSGKNLELSSLRNCNILTGTGSFGIAGYIKGTSAIPTIAYGTGAGTSPATISITGSSLAFKVSFTSGTGCAINSTIFTLTLPYSATSLHVGISARNKIAAYNIGVIFVTTTSNTIVLNSTDSAIADGVEYDFDFVVIGA